MIDAKGHNLVFILSTPRAGSTLLGSVLGNHLEVLCPSEPWLLLPLNALHSDAAAIISPYEHEFARTAWRQWGNDELYSQAVRAFATTIYNRLLAEAGKKIFIDKTPRYYHILPRLDVIFPCALKIWLKRNPLDVIASCKESWQLKVDEFVGYVDSPFAFDTTVSFALLASYFEACAPTQYSLRYEDLVQDPSAQVKAVCDFVGWPFDESMLHYGANSALMQMHAQKTMGDKKILDHTEPHAKSVGRWREILTSEEIKQILLTLGRDVFVRMGYGDLVAEAAARADLDPGEICEKGRLDQIFELYKTYVDQSLLVSGGVQHTRLARENTRVRADLAASEADRAARLEVIEEQGRQLGELEAERNILRYEVADLRQGLANVEADRTARLGVIHAQGQQLGELEAERNQLRGEIADLRRQFAGVEADRAARLDVIESQGRQLGELEAEIADLRRQLGDLQTQWLVKVCYRLRLLRAAPEL